MSENLPTFTCDISEIMTMDDSNAMVEDDNTQETIMESMDDVQDTNENEKQSGLQ